MPNNTLEHERERFSRMTEAQLLTRLHRITDPVKLQNFIRVATELGLNSLRFRAQTRLAGMTISAPPVENIMPDRMSIRLDDDSARRFLRPDPQVPSMERARDLASKILADAQSQLKNIQSAKQIPSPTIEDMIEARKYRMRSDKPDCEKCEKEIPDKDLADNEFLEMYLSSGLCRECQDEALAESFSDVD